MKRLYAPWRTSYTQDTAHTKNENVDEADCIFCTQFKEHDDPKHYILKRGKHTVIMLNRYPYNAGHLLIIPLAHKAHLKSLTQEEHKELMEYITRASTYLQNELSALGINIGINIGKAAGAGIPSHLHAHVLPRWFGDTNFLPTLTETKQISTDLKEVYEKLQTCFKDI